MRVTGDSSWTIRWSSGVPTQTTCLTRAVLLAGVLAVFGLVALKPLLSVFGVTLQVGSHAALAPTLFIMTLPLIWYWYANKGSQLKPITALEFSAEQIRWVEQSQTMPLSVIDVSRHLGSLTVKLQPQEKGKASFSITIWRASVGEQLFRKLSVLIAWHAQRLA